MNNRIISISLSLSLLFTGACVAEHPEITEDPEAIRIDLVDCSDSTQGILVNDDTKFVFGPLLTWFDIPYTLPTDQGSSYMREIEMELETSTAVKIGFYGIFDDLRGSRLGSVTMGPGQHKHVVVRGAFNETFEIVRMVPSEVSAVTVSNIVIHWANRN